MEVKIGRDDFCSIPAPAARVRLTVSAMHAVRTFVRRMPPWMVRVVVMACRVVPGFAPKSGTSAGKWVLRRLGRRVDQMAAWLPALYPTNRPGRPAQSQRSLTPPGRA
ncbi:hypothetical protein HYPDE_27698 [Hyphomicrobium denitrificans 1NES1]|uniref:Uncharacterized protein n=1 Tax=Hyphomicrobium denitrificans 1NES1 TaxID=670307 RepID=N0B162_9HYPH|nr:hypothetical protein HYPDE_27698 [Hyphomicrobium denitrificans 1NES1]